MKWLTLLILIPFQANALMEMDFLNFDNIKIDYEKSHWFFKTGLEYIKYESTFPEFEGQHETIEENEQQDIFGYGLYFGREFYFGKGVSSSLTLGGFVSKTISKDIGKAARDIDFDMATVRRAHQIGQAEATLSLNYLIDNEVLDVQPFIEGGLGVGSATIEKQYQREPVEGASFAEDYDVKTEEQYTFSKISVGANVIASNGVSSYFKVSMMTTLISERETTGDSNAYGTTTVVNQDKSEENLTDTSNMLMASIGLGYLF